MMVNPVNDLISQDYLPNLVLYNTVELPISLNRSYFCASLIKD